ncbi:MAG: S-layer homology domain-containing protein [Syntrophomonadaceae bacterium]|jgi:sugar lactone lactonase YvrE
MMRKNLVSFLLATALIMQIIVVIIPATPAYADGWVVTTLGSGFNGPCGVAVDSSGNIYVADSNNYAIKRMDASGNNITTLGSGFTYPLGITVDSSRNIYVGEPTKDAIKRMDASGNNITTLGSGFDHPESIAVDSSGNIYVADTYNNVIKRMDANGNNITELGSGFWMPFGVTVDDSGNIYVADTYNNVIKRMDASGNNITTLGSGIEYPWGVAVDSSGNIYVADHGNNAIKRMDASGNNITTLASGFNGPRAVAVDSSGNIYVADEWNHAIKKISWATTVNARALDSLVTAPGTGATPSTPAINQAQYTGTVAWYESDGITAVTGNFAESTVYAAKVTLSAKAGYTFTGVAPNSFTYTGATSVTNAADSGTVTITFPATADITPPTVTGVTPDGAGVSISGNIAITFSEAMDNTAAGAVYLSDDGGTTYDPALTGGSWSAGDTVYTIPYSGLSYSTAYTVKIQGFEDVAGHTMATDSTHSFTTCVEPIIPSVLPGTLTFDKGSTASFTIALGQGASMATSADITVANGGIASVSQTQVTTPDTITVTGLSVGTTDITVVFNNTAATTATVSVTVQAVPPTWPSGSSLTASGVSRTNAALTWTAAQDITAVTGYKLYQDGVEIDMVAGDVSNHTVTGLSSATSYTFQVQAGNADGQWTTNGPTVTVQTQSSGGGSRNTPSKPTYTADVKVDGADNTLTITVNMDTSSAAVNVDTQQGNTISGGGNVAITMPSIPGVSSYSLGIPGACLTTPGGGSLTFKTDTGSITIPADMLAGISGAEGRNAAITIGQGDKSGLPDSVKAAIGDRPLIQLSLTLEGKQTDWNNPDSPVTISISYTPTAAELANPESIVIWYIDGSGNLVCIPNGHYDPATGTVTFSATHFSFYAVSYNPVSFNDVGSTDWYYKAVSFIAARGITTGTGSGTFSPDLVLTRADFLVMLMKAYGIAPDTNPADNFSDAGSTYYTGYLAAAKRLGISAGVGNNLYAPGKEITRQEMFTLLYNALKALNKLPAADSGKTLENFIDQGDVAIWATEAMTLLVKSGMVSGSDSKLDPTGGSTRAQMAQVLYNLLGR